jgi:hypothetical protein
MSWATLGNQELISGADLTSAVATAGYAQKPATTIPNDGVVLNSTEINSYVYCTIGSISGNCPAKEDLTALTLLANSGTLYYLGMSGIYPYGYDTPTEACTAGTGAPYSITVYWDGTLGMGINLATDPYGSTWFNLQDMTKWYYLNSHSLFFDGSTIINYNTCTTAITIDGSVINTIDGSGLLGVCVTSVGGAVDTNVTLTFHWEGDLGGSITDTIVLYSGNSCSYQDYLGGTAGENTTVFTLSSITPSSSGTQTYTSGTAYVTGTLPC